MSDTTQYKGYTIKIEQDEIPLNPRTDWDNLGTLVCFNRRNNIGDENQPKSPEALLCALSLSTNDEWEQAALNDVRLHRSPQEFMAELDKLNHVIYLPVYLLDHSGITIRTDSSMFRACDPQGWDWGWAGIIYITKEKAKKEYGWKVINKQRIAKLKEYLEGEIETLDQYITGDVYYYQITNPDGEDTDSCSGYYGHDYEKNGLLEQARNAIDCDIAHRLKTEGVQQELVLA